MKQLLAKMARSIAFLFFQFMITDANHENSDGDGNVDKKERRRIQNVQAAQKSYLAKKQDRDNLQQRNKELTETQMRLLHDKSRLQEHVMLLEKVMNSLNHIFKPCPNPRNSTPEPQTREQSDVAIDNINSPCSRVSLGKDIGQVLAFIGDEHFSPSSDITISDNSNDSVDALVVNESNGGSCDGHVFDESFLDIGATQEVTLEPPIVSRKHTHGNTENSVQDDCMFFPAPKKVKKASLARPIRRCATDVLKKQRSTGFMGCVRDSSLLNK